MTIITLPWQNFENDACYGNILHTDINILISDVRVIPRLLT